MKTSQHPGVHGKFLSSAGRTLHSGGELKISWTLLCRPCHFYAYKIPVSALVVISFLLARPKQYEVSLVAKEAEVNF